MTPAQFILLAAAITLSMATVDFAHARYSRALTRVELGEESPHVPARWSVLQWVAATASFVVAIRVSLYLLPFEGLGLYLGSFLGAQARRTRVPSSAVD